MVNKLFLERVKESFHELYYFITFGNFTFDILNILHVNVGRSQLSSSKYEDY